MENQCFRGPITQDFLSPPLSGINIHDFAKKEKNGTRKARNCYFCYLIVNGQMSEKREEKKQSTLLKLRMSYNSDCLISYHLTD